MKIFIFIIFSLIFCAILYLCCIENRLFFFQPRPSCILLYLFFSNSPRINVRNIFYYYFKSFDFSPFLIFFWNSSSFQLFFYSFPLTFTCRLKDYNINKFILSSNSAWLLVKKLKYLAPFWMWRQRHFLTCSTNLEVLKMKKLYYFNLINTTSDNLKVSEREIFWRVIVIMNKIMTFPLAFEYLMSSFQSRIPDMGKTKFCDEFFWVQEFK